MVACAPEPEPASGRTREPTPSTPELPGNVLVVLLDDVGTDKVSAYAEHPAAPATPTLDALADRGVLFRNAYTRPVCGPTRAALLTGRYSVRTGIGGNYQGNHRGELSNNELTIPEMLASAPVPYASAAIGKWHLVHPEEPDARTHPNDSGFPIFRGTIGNLTAAIEPDGERLGYDHYELLEDGVTTWSDRYATTEMVDLALDTLQALPEPFFVYFAPHAAHIPFHVPPAELLPEPLDPDAGPIATHDAMVQALDHELGRLFDTMDPEVLARTTVVVMGDNGTTPKGIAPPWDPSHGKLTMYEGGINVPLIVAGPTVGAPGTESPALVAVEDLFPTFAAIAGVPVDGLTREDGTPATLDGYDLSPLLADPDAPSPRQFALEEKFTADGPPYGLTRRALLDGDFKLIRAALDDQAEDELYDLRGRDDDGPELLRQPGGPTPEQQAAYDRLLAELLRLEAIPYEGD